MHNAGGHRPEQMRMCSKDWRKKICWLRDRQQLHCQPSATVKSVATDSAASAVVVKITAQIKLSFSNAIASARLALWTALPFTLALMTCSSEHR
jgi:hypothetical protein